MCLLVPLVLAAIWVGAYALTRSVALASEISAGGVAVLTLAGYFIWRRWFREKEEPKRTRKSS